MKTTVAVGCDNRLLGEAMRRILAKADFEVITERGKADVVGPRLPQCFSANRSLGDGVGVFLLRGVVSVLEPLRLARHLC